MVYIYNYIYIYDIYIYIHMITYVDGEMEGGFAEMVGWFLLGRIHPFVTIIMMIITIVMIKIVMKNDIDNREVS